MRTHCTNGIKEPHVCHSSLYFSASCDVFYSSIYIYILHCLSLSLSNQVKEHTNKYFVGAYSTNNITRGFISHRGGYPLFLFLPMAFTLSGIIIVQWHNLKYKGCLVTGKDNNRVWHPSIHVI